MKLLVMQFSPTSCHFIPLWSKYSPHHPVLKHPQSTFLPQCRRPNFKPILNLLSFRYSLFLFLKYLLVSRLTWYRLSPFISLGSCNHCNLACFLCSYNFELPSSNHDLFFFGSYFDILSNIFPSFINVPLSVQVF
jgi:hypothetical protein